jgi:hypothetical protein
MQRTHKTDDFTIIEYEKTNIYVIKDIFDKNFCNNLIRLMNESKQEKLSFSDHNNVECFSIQHFNHTEITNEIIKKFTHIIKIFGSLVKGFNSNSFSMFELRKVYGITRNHTDGIFGETVRHPIDNALLKTIRVATIVVALNDDFDEGVYNFPTQDVKIKLKQGSAVIFPPYWTHPHSVSKIEKNEYRYILSTWALCDNIVIQEENAQLNNIIILKDNK